MKQSSFRLVQRKFAQGVPIPASSTPPAPPPPEKKNDPPATPRSVYQNNISARNLLDIVALQNQHKHVDKPLVLLKRLRDDEIQAAFTTPATGPARRRRGLKANTMALRSRKHKLPEAPKATNKRRRKNASDSTDDLPLAFYEAQKRKVAQANKQRQTRRMNRARTQEKEKRTSNGQTQAKGISPMKRRKMLRQNSTEEGRNSPEARPSGVSQGPARPRIILRFPLKPKPTGKKSKKATRVVGRAPSVQRHDNETPSIQDSTAGEQPDEPSLLVERARPVHTLDTTGEQSDEPSLLVKRAPSVHTLDSTDVSEDGNFTFKEPRNPVSLSYRRFKEQRAAAATARGRTSKKFIRPSCLRTSPRTSASSPQPSSTQLSPTPPSPTPQSQTPPSQIPQSPTPPSPTEEENGGVAMRLRNKLTRGEEPSLTAEREPDQESINSTDMLPDIIILTGNETSMDTDEPMPTDELPNDGSSDIKDWCIEYTTHYGDYDSLQTETYIPSAAQEIAQAAIPPPPPPPLPYTAQREIAKEELTEMELLQPETHTEEITHPSAQSQALRDSIEQYADSELETLYVMKQKMLQENAKNNAGPSGTGKRSTRSFTTKQGKKTQKTQKQTARGVDKRKKRVTRASVATKEAAVRILRNTTVASPVPSTSADVYEFDAEREASRPPSGLRARRNQPKPQPAAAPQEQLDKPTAQAQKRPHTYNSDEKKSIIENLARSPSLLDKFLTYLTPDAQSELNRLIESEQASGGMGDVNNEYLDPSADSLLEAHVYYPTEEEFEDPILYIQKITAEASAFGVCKIVPPAGYKPPCNIDDTIRFAVIYQYISKMYNRWGPVSRELAAIKAHLRTQSVIFARSPLLDGTQLNLPKLYHVVERLGGLNNVMQRKRWGRVADEMKLTRLQHPERKLDPIYMRYLLPYATLSDQERQGLMSEVEKHWTIKYQKMLKRARNPFQRQTRMLSAETENESSDDERDDTSTAGALREAEDCIVPGRTMNLTTFKKIATTLMDAQFDQKSQPPPLVEVEKAYWRAVMLGTDHIVANTASIDTGEEGYGFPKDPETEYGTHPWNLKVLARNPNNVLRFLGEVLGVTVPTMHLNMLFSTSCWHRDPHGLPWIEYLHSGAEKIWYGIPRDQSANFRRAVEALCPAYCQNKSIWLASDITMIPPNILGGLGVKLCRIVQKPGEYVLVFPEAHSCSISTGFGVSESVYFASDAWLGDVYKLFQELRNSCEPTMFSLEQLLLSGVRTPSATPRMCAVLATLLAAELEHRRALEARGLQVQERPPSDLPLNTSYFRALHARDHDDECEYCRCTLYLSKVTGLTGRNSAVCPEHALRLLETKKHKNTDISTLEFLSAYSTSRLEEMVEELEARSGEETIETIDLTAPTPVMDDTQLVMEEPQPSTSCAQPDTWQPRPGTSKQ